MSAVAVAVVEGQGVPQSTGRIEGSVYDSLLTKAPLRGATVYVVGTTLLATTDRRGRFALENVPAGDHTMTFAHAASDSVGVQAPQVGVHVAAASTARVDLALPNAASLLAAMCPGERADQTGLLLGVVREVDTGVPLVGARVVSRWFELSIDRKGPHYETVQTRATADPNGVYRLCGIPADIPVLVRALAGGQESGRAEVYFAGREVAFRDFAISATDSAARSVPDSLLEGSTDSAAVTGPRGAGVARGTIRDTNGRPLANVRVGLLDQTRVVMSDDNGRFTLPGLPAGTQTLELRAIGYAPARRTVVLKSTTPTDVQVTLDRAAQTLASIRVLGERKDGRLTRFGFDDRRRRGIGFFMDAQEIEKRGGIYLGDVLRFAPGVAANYTVKGRTFTMRSAWDGNRCSPVYFLDGMRWYALDQSPILELERFIQLHDLAAVEVYAGGASTPAQFDAGTGCGAVVFWTKQ